MLIATKRIDNHGAGDGPTCSSLILVVCLCLVCFSQLTRADITIDPDSTGAMDVVQDPDGAGLLLVNPLPDPMDLGTDSFAVGKSANGTLAITDGGAVSNDIGYIGYESGATGEVTVDGVDST
jgi:hypothetical protein